MNRVDIFNRNKSPINSISVISKDESPDDYSVDPAKSRKLVKPLGRAIINYHERLFKSYQLRDLVDRFASSVFEDMPKVFPSEDIIMQDAILKKVSEDEQEKNREDIEEEQEEQEGEQASSQKKTKKINSIFKLLSIEKELRLDLQKNTYTQRTA